MTTPSPAVGCIMQHLGRNIARTYITTLYGVVTAFVWPCGWSSGGSIISTMSWKPKARNLRLAGNAKLYCGTREYFQVPGAGFTLSESPCGLIHAFSRDFLADDSPLRGGQVTLSRPNTCPSLRLRRLFEKAARRAVVLAGQSCLWENLKNKWTRGYDNES